MPVLDKRPDSTNGQTYFPNRWTMRACAGPGGAARSWHAALLVVHCKRVLRRESLDPRGRGLDVQALELARLDHLDRVGRGDVDELARLERLQLVADALVKVGVLYDGLQ